MVTCLDQGQGILKGGASAAAVDWVGTNEHHCTAIDAEGERRLSRRVANDETTLLELIGELLELSEREPVTWAVDLNAGGAALLIALLAAQGRKVLHIPGRTVHHASGSYRGDGKTDAKAAYVIAAQARTRRDLHPLQEQTRSPSTFGSSPPAATASPPIAPAPPTGCAPNSWSTRPGTRLQLHRLQGRADPAYRPRHRPPGAGSAGPA
ncbi:IS110 family transposase [Streptomyces anthocyanicus]|nr:IS110 family transposase [Streptomyces anthocyanicus]